MWQLYFLEGQMFVYCIMWSLNPIYVNMQQGVLVAAALNTNIPTTYLFAIVTAL
jgi:hypothetical protein